MTLAAGPETVDEIVAAAAALIDAPLTNPVDLGGTARTTVLRCTTPDGSVIVKAYRPQSDALAAFTHESAALRLGAGPELVGIDPSARVIVMADLGTAPSLADVLVGEDQTAASNALIGWAIALGGLAADTIDRREEFETLRKHYDTGRPGILDIRWLTEELTALPDAIAAVGVKPPAGFAAEIATLLDDRYPALSPGDACPDNNLITADGIRLIDFEGAGYRPVFLDAAYLRVPFPTCWCVFRLPAGLAKRAEESYRAEVARAYPDLADDSLWEPAVRGASIAWLLWTTAVLPSIAEEDARRGPPDRLSPTWRQLLRHRWQALAAVDEYPAIGETARKLLSATDSWDAPPLPAYPAFVSGWSDRSSLRKERH